MQELQFPQKMETITNQGNNLSKKKNLRVFIGIILKGLIQKISIDLPATILVLDL